MGIKELAKRAEITKEQKLDEWTINAFENYSTLKEKTFIDLGTLVDTRRGTCVLVASGPSLNYAMDTIRSLSAKGNPIICGASQAMALKAHGITPDYIAMYDSHQNNFDFLRPDVIDWGRTALVTHPCCDPRTLKYWRGDIIMYKIGLNYHESHKDTQGLSVKEFMDKYKPSPDAPISWYIRDEYLIFMINTLQRSYPQIPFRILASSCTPTNTMFIADCMGFDNALLVGFDNGFTHGLSRADSYRYDPIPETIARTGIHEYDKKAEWIVKSDNGIDTTKQLLSYRLSIIYTAARIQINIVELHAGEPGTLDFFPVLHKDDLDMGNIPVFMDNDRLVAAQNVFNYEHEKEEKENG